MIITIIIIFEYNNCLLNNINIHNMSPYAEVSHIFNTEYFPPFVSISVVLYKYVHSYAPKACKKDRVCMACPWLWLSLRVGFPRWGRFALKD